ncbi:MAG: carbohydrate kinase family protein [Armatimonadota bacterium]
MPEIISVGELIVDVMRMKVDEPLDEPGIFAGAFPSGAPAIFIDQCALLGRSTGFIAAVGDDDFGRMDIRRLAGHGVDTTYIAVVPEPSTGCAFVTYFSNGDRRFLFHIGNSAASHLPEPPAEWFEGCRWLHVCGSSLSAGERMREGCYRAARLAHEAGARISFDPNLRPELLGGAEAVREVCAPIMALASLVLPSASEAEVLTETSTAEDACAALLQRGVEIVALKRGAAGCTVITAGGQTEVAGYPVTAVDPTGAGDCFDAGFVVGLSEGLSLEECGRLANACGAAAAGVRGPMEGSLTREEAFRRAAIG